MKKYHLLLSLFLMTAFLLSACAPAAAPQRTAAPASTEAPAATEAPAVTEAPATTEAPAATEAPAEPTKAPEPTKEAAPAEPAGGDVALKVTGLVEKEMGWSEAEVKAMDTTSAESTNKKGVTETYTGVLISKLLELAGVKAEAKTVVFVADDGFTAEIALADLMSCTDCIVSFRTQGGFSTVLPGQSSKLQVKGVVEIQVK